MEITNENMILPQSPSLNNATIATDKKFDDILQLFNKIFQCSIIKYGVKPSLDFIPFAYCNTCDINLIYPICMICIERCHNGHSIKYKGKQGKIVCACGERMHKFNSNHRNKVDLLTFCPYSDWCNHGNISTMYMVDNNKAVCLFCYVLCNFNKGTTFIVKEGSNITCQCDNIKEEKTHCNLKEIYSKMNLLLENNSLLMKQLGPIRILNLFFIGKVSYTMIYLNFDEMFFDFDNLKNEGEFIIKDIFLQTNFFLILNNFTTIANSIKNTPIRYFSQELCDKLSFDCIKKIVKGIKYSDSKPLWLFLYHLLFLYRKVVIGDKMKAMVKFKLYDLENFSFIQRYCLFHSNKSKIFSNFQEQIIFFIDILSFYLNSPMTFIEGYNCIIQICCILKQMNQLFTLKSMVQFCYQIDNCFNIMKKFKNFHMQLQLFYIVIKMFHCFAYNYNDEIFYDNLSMNDLIDLKKDMKIAFFFSRNELGRLISCNVIKIMFACTENNLHGNITYEEDIIMHKIQQHGMTILSFLINPNDSYLINLNKMTRKCNEYYELINMTLNNYLETYFDYSIIEEAHNQLELDYQQYFTFKINQENLIKEAQNILERVLSNKNDKKQHGYLLKSNLYFSIVKILYIIEFSYVNKQHHNFIQILFDYMKYFIENNSDNALLILSHYYINALVKLPYQYANIIFSLWYQCCELISMQDTVIAYPKQILKNMCIYLINLKEINVDDTNKINQLINLYLIILEKILINTKSINSLVTQAIGKQIIIKLLIVFEYDYFISKNMLLILVLSNGLFDSSNLYEREQLLKLIPIDIMINKLNDLTIDLEYRTEILNFIKKNRYNMHFEDNDNDNDISHHSSNSINNTMHNYINAFLNNSHNFIEICNSALISNNQYPFKYLSFYYDMLKMNRSKDNKKMIYDNSPIDLYIKEISIIKQLFFLHLSKSEAFINYLSKGVILPLISIVWKALCYTHDMNGNQILSLYNLAITVLYLKRWIFTLGKDYEMLFRKQTQSNFILFTSEEHKNICNQDYIDLKEKRKSSPFDYTYLYTIFQRHLFCFANYPQSMKLTENFSYNINDQNILKNTNLN